MRTLFDPTVLHGLALPNRFVRSATWEGLADPQGRVTPPLTELMVTLARNGVGLIITGYAFVDPAGQSSPGQLAAADEGCVAGLQAMVQAVHAAGGRIALQLVHGGACATPELTGRSGLGPSEGGVNGQSPCRAMTAADCSTVAPAFAAAATRAQRAGFDAVQLHAAHGFLLSQFLSPAFNRRTDGYGGPLAHRARLLLEVAQQVRAAVGPAYPLLVKLNSEDFLEGGMTRAEAVEVAAWLAEASIDAIELSGGTVASPQTLLPPRPGKLATPEAEVYYREAARLYKQRVPIPLMLVGGIRSYVVAEQLVAEGITDYVALARPLIAEPDLVRRWAAGDHRPAACGSCNGCFRPALAGQGVYCVRLDPQGDLVGASA